MTSPLWSEKCSWAWLNYGTPHLRAQWRTWLASTSTERAANWPGSLPRAQSPTEERPFRRRGRTKFYQIAERMYNIYYLMRRRGGPSDRVKALVRFMLAFYDPEELANMTARFAQEARFLPEAERGDYLALFKDLGSRMGAPELQRHLAELARALQCSEPMQAEANGQSAETRGAHVSWGSAPADYEALLKLGSEAADDPKRVDEAVSIFRRAAGTPSGAS